MGWANFGSLGRGKFRNGGHRMKLTQDITKSKSEATRPQKGDLILNDNKKNTNK